MRRILIVSHTYVAPGTRGKLRALAARGLDVTVGVPQRWMEPVLRREIVTAWERQSGVEVFPIPANSAAHPEQLRFRGRALAALVRDKRPDLIQVEEEILSPSARQVVRLGHRQGMPLVLLTSQTVPAGSGLFAGWRRRRVLGALRGVLATNGAAAELVRHDRPDLPVAVVPQVGVSVPPAPVHAPHEGLAIGYIGRLVPRKGLDTLLQALALNRGDPWHLTVVGDGPGRERLEAMASELRLAARIRWAGALPSEAVTQLWEELDVLVLPSRAEPGWREPSGHVLVEAMAHEVAVVGSDTGVIPEVIGEAGVVVPAGQPDALAAALARLADDTVRRPLAQAGRARAMKEFSDDAIAERTMTFWKLVLQERGAGSST